MKRILLYPIIATIILSSVLALESITDQLDEGQEKTFTLGSRDYRVVLDIVTTTETRFTINDERTTRIGVGESFTFSDGLRIKIEHILNREYDHGIRGVSFTLSSGTLREESCSDGIQNQEETDTDCGGECDGCQTEKRCRTDSDCLTNYCAYGLCRTANCGDNIKNQDESDIDCGGSCAECDQGNHCNADADCQSQQCYDTVCTDVSVPIEPI